MQSRRALTSDVEGLDGEVQVEAVGELVVGGGDTCLQVAVNADVESAVLEGEGEAGLGEGGGEVQGLAVEGGNGDVEGGGVVLGLKERRDWVSGS